MQNKRKKTITEAAAEAMGIGGYSVSGGRGAFDGTGKPDMISQPIVTGMPAASPGVPAPIVPNSTGPRGTKMASPEPTEDQDEQEGAEESEVEATPTSMPIQTTEETKAQFRDALVALLGEDVDPTLITQLEAIFEAAVTDRVERTVENIVQNVDQNVQGYLDNVTESLVEKVDDYLDYVVEEWMTENAVAVEQGLKTQIAENFISGLKNLFENHYIDVPAEKYNVLDDLYAQNRKLEETLNEAVKINMQLKKEVSLTECAGIFVAETRDLADTQVAKLQNLMETVAFETPEEYREKLVAIRENYLNRNRPAPSPAAEPEQTFATVKQMPNTLVENYVGALGRLNKKI